jgi:nuclear receptor interaction protein
LRPEDFEVDEDEEVDDDDDDDFDDDDEGWSPRGARSSEGRFKSVDLLYPRRSFKGARNVETVKDCNFLGDSSDKVAQGSDDGNFFVWDKVTGRLEGIWQGDGDIVNVMEQHPTLPLVAVSGIDSTVKMFAPTSTPLADGGESMRRLDDSENIIRRNANPRRSFAPVVNTGALQLLSQILAERRSANPHASEGANLLDLFRQVAADPDEEPGPGVGECHTQ